MDNTPSPEPFNKHSSGLRRNKRAVWVGIALILAVAAGVVMLLMSMNGAPTPENSTVGEVTINGTALEPQDVSIKKGQSVMWTNQGDSAHQLTSDDLPDFSTDEAINPGESFSYTFDDPGTFHYYDPAQPTRLKGTVTVE